MSRAYRVTLADALTAHDEALTYGGRDGITSLDLIESALGRPYSGYHRTISKKAAALLQSMVKNHGFVDGNKRTAAVVAETFLVLNGYTFNTTDAELVVAVMALAAGDLSEEELADWFRGHLAR